MLDTNICIYIIKQKPESVLKKFTSLAIDDICISSITLSELTYGVQKSQHKQKNIAALEEFVTPLIVAPFDDLAANTYGEVRANLERQGTPIGSLDTMIAAHAITMNTILVTNNEREFNNVSNLKLANWI